MKICPFVHAQLAEDTEKVPGPELKQLELGPGVDRETWTLEPDGSPTEVP